MENKTSETPKRGRPPMQKDAKPAKENANKEFEQWEVRLIEGKKGDKVSDYKKLGDKPIKNVRIPEEMAEYENQFSHDSHILYIPAE